MPDLLLDVRDMNVDYKVPFGKVRVLRDVSLSINRGEVLSIVGESGSGKTTFALTVSRLLAPNATISRETKVLFRG